jgi:hypothetical protein
LESSTFKLIIKTEPISVFLGILYHTGELLKTTYAPQNAQESIDLHTAFQAFDE